MKNRQKHTALFFSFLIAVGFVFSGYHYHNDRSVPDDHPSETHLISSFDNCLFCEGVFLYDISEPATETELDRHPEQIVLQPVSIISGESRLLPENRAPPSM